MEARYFISNWKIIRVNSIAGKTFLSIVEQSPPLYLLCDEVVCSWNEKGKVMRKLLADMERKKKVYLKVYSSNIPKKSGLISFLTQNNRNF